MPFYFVSYEYGKGDAIQPKPHHFVTTLVQNFRANPNEASLNSANRLITKEIKAVDNNKIIMLMATSINLGRKLSIRLSILGLHILTNC